MQKSLWLPFWVGIGLILISLPLVLLLPQAHSDTGKGAASLNPHTDNVSDSETSPLIPENEPGFSGPEEDELRRCPEPVEAKSDKGITKGILSDYVALVARRRDFQLLLVAFCLSGLSSSAISLLLIYISKRLQWPFARVSCTSQRPVLRLTMAGRLSLHLESCGQRIHACYLCSGIHQGHGPQHGICSGEGRYAG